MWKNKYESLSNIEINESLFKLDFNMLASAKKFIQKNVSEEDDN